MLILGEFFVAPRESSTLLVGVGPKDERPEQRYQSSFYRSTAQIATSPRNLGPVDVTVTGVSDVVDSSNFDVKTTSKTSTTSRSTSSSKSVSSTRTTSSSLAGRNTTTVGYRREASDSKTMYSGPGETVEVQLQGSERK